MKNFIISAVFLIFSGCAIFRSGDQIDKLNDRMNKLEASNATAECNLRFLDLRITSVKKITESECKNMQELLNYITIEMQKRYRENKEKESNNI